MKSEIAIGELSRQTGCNIETIRYYERISLLPKARREKSGRFRRYDGDDIARLRFIRRARERFQHLVRHVDAEDPTLGSDLFSGDKAVEATASRW